MNTADKISNEGTKKNNPIAVCFELPGEMTDTEAREAIEKMKKALAHGVALQRWVHRWDPSLGSSPVFYCP
jgi:actin-like ATPase involved in cell morphogenesis